MIHQSKSIIGFVASLAIVALGQPARVGWLGAVAALCGYALFFNSLPSHYSARRRFLCGTMWFFCVQLVQLSWMTSIEFQGYYILFVYFLLSLGIGAQFGILTAVVPASGKISVLKAFNCAALWTLMEWSRLFFLCGYSWNPMGLSLTHFMSSLQFASLFGVLGLTFWVMLTNLMGLNVLRKKSVGVHVLACALLAAVPYVYGVLHTHYHEGRSWKQSKKIDVALVQTDLLPSEKIPHPGKGSEFISPFEQWERILKSLRAQKRANLDMIVFPEAFVPLQSDATLYPYDRVEEVLIKELGVDVRMHYPPFVPPYAEERIVHGMTIWCVSNLFWCQTLSNYFGADLVAGLDHRDETLGKNFNSAFYFKPGGQTLERYDKQVLLPLAEYLPLDFLRPLTKSYGISDFFAQGVRAEVFGQKTIFSPSICYEEIFSEIMREGRLKGAGLFVNVTNDNYFPDSSLHKQHLFHARVRAVENGIPLIRSCNSGMSAAIDSFGGVNCLENGSLGVLSCQLNGYTYTTLYTFFGEAGIVSLCCVLSLCAWRRNGLRKKKISEDVEMYFY